MMKYVLIVLLIALSAMFSGSELAFASSSEIKLRKKSEKDNRLALLALSIFNDYDKSLITILVGNNLVNISSSAIATMIALEIMGDSGAPIATAIMTVLIIIFGEITPKVIASRNPEKFAILVSLPIKFLMWLTLPVVYLVNIFIDKVSVLWKSNMTSDDVTEDDLETIIDTVSEEGVIDEDTADLLQNVIDFHDVQAYEIITHRIDIEGIDIEDSYDINVNKIMNTQYSRLPVYRDNLDNPVGFVVVDECLKAMLNNEFEPIKYIRKALFVHKTMPLDDVLYKMRKKKCHLLFVSDEYGGTMGIITMEDVLEQIVGEIWDEKDEIDEEFEEIKKNVYEVSGDMRIEDLFEELDIEDKDFESDNKTVGGWAIEMMEEYPSVKDSFDYQGYKFTIAKMKKRRVMEIKVTKI